MNRPKLPVHSTRHYAPVGQCIYCGVIDSLSKEHIVPYSAGGNWTLPKASCVECSKITGTFEGEFSRTILGPLRMLYNMPTRRPKERPAHLPLKVKYPNSADWEIAHVDRSICPFLIVLPIYDLPDALTGRSSNENGSAASAKFWIRGGGFWPDRDAQLEALCQALGAIQVMPTGTVNTESLCLTIAKVAHAFAVAELGLDAFEPFLREMIRNKDVSTRKKFIGGGDGNEPPGKNLHEINLVNAVASDPSIVAVSVRLFAILGMPTYHVAVGRYLHRSGA